jgi:hypothetical protein
MPSAVRRPASEPRSREKQEGNRGGKDQGSDEEVLPADGGNQQEADSQRPGDTGHLRQSFTLRASELPRQNSCKQKKYADEKSEAHVKVVVGAMEPLRIKMHRAHGSNQRVHAPLGKGLLKAESVPYGKKREQNCRHSIDYWDFHCSSQAVFSVRDG